MAQAAQRFSEIARDGTHVAALAADQFEHDLICIDPLDKGEFVHIERAGRDIEIFFLTGEGVGALPVNLMILN